MSKTEYSVDQDELADKLAPLVVGQKIVSTDPQSGVITLSNGKVLKLSGSYDCCAFGDVTIGELIDSEHVVTSVTSTYTDDNDSYNETAKVFILTGAGPALELQQEWNASNGYYFYGLYLEVTDAD